ncbi:hypothetical protein [uncultured Acetobacteroides sp.]|uniref:hypothetical protein n=1 Tax=uncultured Acetobacteroides sp. TaxID=1760811 RepID=UPI0029F5C659|nr:hypothetical protein [uncultured Acetobacteroides sp.]
MVKKSKASTYILLILVVGIWGVVVYRIVEARKGDSFAPSISLSAKGSKADSAYTLKLSYRDPFLNTPGQQPRATPKAIAKPQPIVVKPKRVSYASLLGAVRSAVTYNGLIANRSKSGLMGIVQANGEVVYIRNQSYIDSLTVTHICKDSITLKGRYSYTIRKIQ